MPKRKRSAATKRAAKNKKVVSIIEEEKEHSSSGEEAVAPPPQPKKILKKRDRKAENKIPRELDIRASFPLFAGKTMHLGTQKGDIANRVIICSDEKIAFRLSKFFDNPNEVRQINSPRHFITYTGLFKGTPISVIASGMGQPMIDFTMRETKIHLDGPMACVRYGSCCSISNCAEGDVVVGTDGAFNVTFDLESKYGKDDTKDYYRISDIAGSDNLLNAHLKKAIKNNLMNPEQCKEGLLGTSDSFYSSQARYHTKFLDKNENLINEILKKYPKAKTIDMESHTVIGTALMAKKKDIHASAVSLVVVNRMHYGEQAPPEKMLETQDLAGYGIFKALHHFDFPDGEPVDTIALIKKIKTAK
ncbi:unnamed protein product [Moneuplotes crassus]|uniref:Nucleoside phosphorylase domain-containing protein n=1 Tax=Euplotes crassus TaxID=5936 RepID=A0AAD1XIW3_EUPCR|nr:unnamed protein product [Moneuplotes crassus]